MGAFALVLAVFSIIVASNQDETASHIKQLVANAHDATQEDYGSYCTVCHGNVYSKDTISRKWLDADGGIITEKAPNQHVIHRDSEVVEFNGSCTFCHVEFEVADETDSLLISNYVDKLKCASCHSRFSPRQLMEPDLAELSKNPPPDDPSCTCSCCHFGWTRIHELSEVSNQFVQNLRIGPAADDCLVCHGENAFTLPREIQDAYWGDKVSEFSSDYSTN